MYSDGWLCALFEKSASFGEILRFVMRGEVRVHVRGTKSSCHTGGVQYYSGGTREALTRRLSADNVDVVPLENGENLSCATDCCLIDTNCGDGF